MWMLKRHRKEREKLDDVLRLPLLVVRFVAFMRISVGSRDCIEISFTSTMVFFISYFLSLSTFSFDETSKCISLFILSLSLSFVSQYFWVTQGVVPSLRWPWICCYFTIFFPSIFGLCIKFLFYCRSLSLSFSLLLFGILTFSRINVPEFFRALLMPIFSPIVCALCVLIYICVYVLSLSSSIFSILMCVCASER